MARRGSGKRGQRVATPTVAALAGLPAGVELLSAIAELDLSSLTGFDLPLLLRAVYRLGNHTRALLLDVVAEVMRRRDPDGNGTGGWDAVAVHEVRAALTMSRTAANSLNHLAQDLYERLPQVLDAMRDGRLDQPRARVFSSWTGWLSDAHARAIVDALLPIAPKLTTGELIDEIRRVAIELDPDFARRQHDHGRSQRRVHGAIGRDGTGHITAEGLSAEQIAAACDRLDAIGWYLKRAGHPDKLDHIRTDVFAGLLTGQFAGLTDEQLLEKLLTNMPAAPTPDSPFTSDTQPSGQGDLGEHAAADGRDDDAPGSARDGAPGELGAIDGDGGRMRDLSIEDPTRAAGNEMPDDNPFDDSPGNERPEEEPPEEAPEDQPPEEEPPEDEPPEEEPPEGDRGGGPGVGPTGGGPAGPGGGSATPAERDSTMDAAGRGPGAPRGTPHSGTPPGPGHDPPDGRGGDRENGGVRLHRRGLRLWVGLGTIAGQDRRPGELLGWGLLHAELARKVAAAPAASWWYALTDRRGRPLQVGLVRRRPAQPWWDGEPVDVHGVEVWLQLTTAELAGLVAHPPPGWERPIDDIRHRVINSPAGAPNGDPTDRFPNAGLRRYLSIRDRRCMFPTCRIPSHRCQADHTIDHALGGQTVDINMSALCAGDHALKTNHGWRARQRAPGHLIWTSPMGHRYERRPPRGPAHARPPMPNPARPEHDWFRPLSDDEYEEMFGIQPPPVRESPLDREWWTNTCLTDDDRPDPNAPPRLEPEPKPNPEPKSKKVPVMPEPSPEDDPIPF